MKAFVACIFASLAVVAIAEPPSGYNYNRPAGLTSGGGGHGGLGGQGAGYQAVAPGGQSSEGQNLDQGLLEQIRQILLNEESNSGAGGHSGALSGPSSSYGAPSAPISAPSSSYGAPSAPLSAPSSSYGAPSAPLSAPSSSYGAPSAPISAPSSSYGAPSAGYSSRVTGVDIEGVRQAIQVAQFYQASVDPSGGGSGGYPQGPASAPQSSYGAPAAQSAPSQSYGAPY